MIGVDIASVERISKAIASDAFISRVFTAAERAYCDGMPQPAQSYAGIFCAKEAAVKALGVGFGSGIMPTDIEISHDGNGAPHLSFFGKAAELVGDMATSVSISHDGGLAIAVVEIIATR